jgi:hypothetical protein
LIGHRIFALFSTQRAALRVGVKGKAQDMIRVNRAQLEATYLPPWWKDEAKTVEEWFIRLCRNLGFYATYDEANKRFEVRLIKSDADQATIELPGIDNLSAPKHAKGWGGHEESKS